VGKAPTTAKSRRLPSFRQQITMATQKPAKINTEGESQAVAEQNAKELETAAGQGKQGKHKMGDAVGGQSRTWITLSLITMSTKWTRFWLINRCFNFITEQ